MTIIFESHSTSLDNEKQLASGWNDVELSELGIQQAKDLGERRKNEHFEAIFCSDLQRSFQTAKIAFGEKFPIIKDKRLRECNYGDLAGHPSDEVEPQKINHIREPFPNGESYEDCLKRMKGFLDELRQKYHGRDISEAFLRYANVNVLIIGHRATQYGLEHWINRVPLDEIILSPWSWQPGWIYQLHPVPSVLH